MRTLLRVALAVLAALAVVVLPSTAWAEPRPSTFTYTQQECGWATAGIVLGVPTSGTNCDTTGQLSVSWGDNPLWDPAQKIIIACFEAHGGCPSPGYVVQTLSAGTSIKSVPNNAFTFARSYELWQGSVGGDWLGRYVFNAQGSVVPDPSDAESASTCDSFKNVQTVLQDGTLDLRWNWKGAIPARGWEVTDAGLFAPVSAGALLAAVPASDVPAGSGFYGFTEWSIPAGPGALRVRVKGTPSCFIGFKLTRDPEGSVTSVVGGGTVTDTTPPEGAKDEDDANCGTLDVVCMLKWLFIPDPASWGWQDLVTQAKGRPPFSIGIELGAAIGAVVGHFDDGCRAGGYFPIPGVGTVSPTNANEQGGSGCSAGNAWTTTDGAAWLRSLMQLALYMMTAFLLWGMAESAFNGGGGGDS